MTLRSKRLARVFSGVWESLPKKDQVLLSSKILLVVDDPFFIPKGHRPKWGAAIGIKFKKSIVIVYLSPRKLARQPEDFIRYVIAHELAHVRKGHIEQLFLPTFNEAACELEADQQVKKWGFPIPSKK